MFDYAVEIDRGGRMTVPGGAQLEVGEGWSPDHLLLAALVRCSIESLVHHARRAGHEARASGSASGTVTTRENDGRYAELTPRAPDVDELVAKAQRDCFVGATLTVEPRYEWHLS